MPIVRATALELACLTFVVLSVTVRWFTETSALLPRAFNGFDLVVVPALTAALVAPRVARRRPLRTLGLHTWVWLFCVACTASMLANLIDVRLGPAALFVVNHLLPILFALAVANAPVGPRFGENSLTLLVALGLVNLLVAITQLGGLGEDPDALVGTFGANANQMAMFLALVSSVFLTRAYCGISPVRNLLFAIPFVVFFFLSGFKSMWLLFPLVLIVTFFTQLEPRLSHLFRGLAASTAVVLGTAFLMLLIQPPQLGYLESLTRLDLASFGKVQVAASLPSLWMDRPWAMAIGVGPGTFSSRAFRTFADLPYRGAGDAVSYGPLG